MRPNEFMGKVQRLLTACMVLGLLSRVVGAEGGSSLPQTAGKYGVLMSDHWLVVDTVRQIDRALFYRSDASATGRFGGLKKTVAEAERKLEEGRILYKRLYKTNSTDGLAHL